MENLFPSLPSSGEEGSTLGQSPRIGHRSFLLSCIASWSRQYLRTPCATELHQTLHLFSGTQICLLVFISTSSYVATSSLFVPAGQLKQIALVKDLKLSPLNGCEWIMELWALYLPARWPLIPPFFALYGLTPLSSWNFTGTVNPDYLKHPINSLSLSLRKSLSLSPLTSWSHCLWIKNKPLW